jgi:hypothetical protein
VLTVADDGIGLPRSGEVAGGAPPPHTPPRGSGLGTGLLGALACNCAAPSGAAPAKSGVGMPGLPRR